MSADARSLAAEAAADATERGGEGMATVAKGDPGEPAAPPAAAPALESGSPRARLRRFFEQVAGMDDPPHQLALGLAIGVFVGFLPIMGVQTWVALPIAALTGGNKALAVAGVWISNPVTFIPFYYACYRFGLWVHTPMNPLSVDQFRQLMQDVSFSGFLELGAALVVPLTIGGVVLGLAFGVLTYIGMMYYLRRRKSAPSQKATQSPCKSSRASES